MKEKKITNQKLKKISDFAYTCYYSEDLQRYKKYYLSGRRKYAKYCSKKKIRNAKNDAFALKGNNHRKLYDYWWEID
jgi:hypothetical protein